MNRRTALARPAATLLALAAACQQGLAQTDPEYRAEIGAGAGFAAYQGDLGGGLLKGMQPMYGVVAKYRPNPRAALSLHIASTKLTGDSEGTNTWYAATADSLYSFSSPLVDVGLRLEYNFWPFGTGREYRGAMPLTPYIAIGLGATVAKPEGGSVFALNLPIGVGVKYKLAQRVNLSLEWAMHFTGSDKLDGMADPYGIKSSGLFKNTDCYSTLQLSLTYDVMAKCRTCHNESE